MKDYYYFLGLERDVSAEEVKKAYRKLSMKYHPDKSENDPFFQKRFRDLKEAYQTLGDADRRRTYDHLLELSEKNARSGLPPEIYFFRVNKVHAVIGEELLLSWQTSNADVVKIYPYGLQKSSGEMKIRVEGFNAEGKFRVILNATNTLLNQTIARGITISSVPDFPFKPLQKEQKSETKFAETEVQLPVYLKWIALFLVLAVIFLVILLQKN